jgi:lysophospholipase
MKKTQRSEAPLVNEKWWREHVIYSSIEHQKIEITCASFIQKQQNTAHGNVVVVTGLMETFLRYSELIQTLYENGFNVFTYDHQSQGLSGRCKYLS